MKRSLLVGLLLGGTISLGLLWHEVSLRECTQDDSFISFRYAANLAEGKGLVFNPGEERVEGYTNFLWTVILAGFIFFQFDPVPVSWVLGVACGFGILWCTALLSIRFCKRKGWEAIPSLALFAASSAFAAEAVQGLETLFFSLLVLAGTYALLRGREAATGWWVASALLFGLSSLTRPEGALVAFIGFLFLLGDALTDTYRGTGSRSLVRSLGRPIAWAGIFASLFAPYLLWRYLYYGFLVPNTFYAKTGGGLAQITRGVQYSANFFWAIAPVLLLAAWFLFRADRERKKWVRFPVLLVLVYTIYVTSVGGDFKLTFRFFMPVLAFLILLAQEGMFLLAGRFRSRSIRYSVLAVLLIASCGHLFIFSQGSRNFARGLRESLVNKKLIAKHLQRITRKDDLLAIGTVGIVPYYTRLPTLDMWGLNDLHIAHKKSPWAGRGSAGHEKGDGRYVFDRRPEIIIFRVLAQTPIPFPEKQVKDLWTGMFLSERELVQIPEFLDRYELRSDRLIGFYFNYFRLRE